MEVTSGKNNYDSHHQPNHWKYATFCHFDATSLFKQPLTISVVKVSGARRVFGEISAYMFVLTDRWGTICGTELYPYY